MTAAPAPEPDSKLSRARYCDQLCDRFEGDWKAAGETADPPRIEDFLVQAAESEREALLCELLHLDIYYRQRRGETPQPEDYRPRFPSLDAAGVMAAIAACGAPLPASPGYRGGVEAASAGRGANGRLLPDELAPQPDGSPSVGRRFGDYELLAEIARGGMGVVYKARQAKPQRTVALKMILAGPWASNSEIQRFHTEAEAAANLDHPGIVPIYEVGQHEGHHYFSMGYVEGESLAVRLAAGPVPPRQAAELVRDVAHAVQYAHEHGVIHRDLKPANILVDRTGRPRVTDFGLAKRVAADSDLTVSGQILGTPTYLPPEQATANFQAIGPGTDVYALGAVLYALLTGRPPFHAANVAETIRQVIEDEPLSLRQVNPAVPCDLETIALKCLQKSPPRRYRSAALLAEDLDRWLAGIPILARRSRAWERAVKWIRRRPALSAALAACLVIAVVAFAMVTSFWRSAERARRDAQQLTLRLALERGQALAEHGDVGRGMLWLASALPLVPPSDAARQAAIRTSLWAWGDSLRPLRAMLAHPGPTRWVGFSPEAAEDRRTLLTLGADNTIRVWDPAAANLRTAPLPHAARVLAIACSSATGQPDGSWALTGCEDGKARLWDVLAGKVVEPLWDHEGPVAAVAFSPRQPIAATGSRDGQIRLWQVPTGQLLRAARHAAPVTAVAFSPDGKQLLTGSRDGTARLWHADTLEPAASNFQHPEAEVWAVQFSPDGRTLLTADQSHEWETGEVHLWDASTGRPLAKLQQRWAIRAVAFSPAGELVLTGSEDNTAQLWQVATGQPLLATPLQHQDAVVAVAFSPDGQTALTGSQDRTARLWDAHTGRPLGPPLEHPGPVAALAFSPDGRTLVTAGQESAVRVWDAANPTAEQLRVSADSEVMALAVSADGQTVAVGTSDHATRLWDVPSTEWLGSLAGHTDEVWAMAFAPDGTVVTGSADGTARLWDPETRQALPPVLRHGFRVRAVAASPDAETILTGGGTEGQGAAYLWRRSTGQQIEPPLESPAVVWAVAFGRHVGAGEICAVASGDNTIRLWRKLDATDVAHSASVTLPPLHQGRVVSLAFSPDGRWLLSGSIDQTARLWSVASGEPAGEPLQHPSAVWAVSVSADGRLVITGCRDGTVHVWDAATGMPLGPAWQHQGPVWGLAYDMCSHTVWSGAGGEDHAVHQWRLPTPVLGDPGQVMRWAEVITGLEFDQHQIARWLDAETWQQRRREAERSSVGR